MVPSSCIFCKIAQSGTDTDILYRDDLLFVIRDIIPKAVVHLLLIPVMHVTSLSASSFWSPEPVDQRPPEKDFSSQLFTVAGTLASQMGISDTGYRLVLNQGPHSGQQIAHLHFHLLGGNQLADIG